MKKKSKTAIIAVVITLLLALPIGVYYISQQNQEIADTRSSAWGTGYQGCTANGGNDDGQGSCPNGYVCHCQDGTQCTETRCELLSETRNSCALQGRAWCDNAFGNGWTCCYPGYSCGQNNLGCIENGGGGGNTPTRPPNSTNTPTPTTGTSPVCQNIKLYKDGTQVTDLTTLEAGDDVVLAVKGNLAPTKAHFRVNGGNWTETTAKNAANEFTLSYTIPAGVPDFVIEAEVFTNGAWR